MKELRAQSKVNSRWNILKEVLAEGRITAYVERYKYFLGQREENVPISAGIMKTKER